MSVFVLSSELKKFMENLDINLLEKLAEAAHEIFYKDLIIKGNSLLKPYAKLSEDEKESNRNNVRDILNKLTSVGYTMVQTRGSETPSKFKNDEIEKLAKMEHERWMQEKLDNGWQYAKKTDRVAKLHKSLIPWNELSENEKEKDRVLVKGIPKILAKAGYTMIKLS